MCHAKIKKKCNDDNDNDDVVLSDFIKINVYVIFLITVVSAPKRHRYY